MQVHILVQRFEQSGSAIARRHGNIGRPQAVRSSESTEQVNSVIGEMHQKSVRRQLGNLTNTASVSSIYGMLRYDLNWTTTQSCNKTTLKTLLTSVADLPSPTGWKIDQLQRTILGYWQSTFLAKCSGEQRINSRFLGTEKIKMPKW